MALDKNYVDKTSFEVLQPAIDYYISKGSATDQLRTYYYQGRIYHNQGDEAQAMNCYVLALDVCDKSEDRLTMARTLVAQSIVYNALMKWDKSCEANLKAAAIFEEYGRINNYVNCLIKVAGNLIHRDCFDEAKKYLDICNQYTNVISHRTLSDYYESYLSYLISTDSRSDVEKVLNEYHSTISDKFLAYTTIARAYYYLGELDTALQMIANVEIVDGSFRELKYYALLTRIYQKKGDYKKALEYYQQFKKLDDKQINSAFEQETQFAEERITLELQIAKERESKNRLLLICVCLTSVFSLSDSAHNGKT